MTPLEDLLRRIDLDEPLLTGDDRRAIPAEDWDRVVALGLLREAAAAEFVRCDDCYDRHEEDVQWIAEGGALRPFVECPDVGLVPVDPERLRQWRIDLARFAALLAAALACAGRVEELVPGRLWLLGHLGVAERPREVFLGRGLARRDGATVVAGCTRLRSAIAPAVLVAGDVPDLRIWNGREPPVLAVPSFVAMEGDALVADRAYVGAALGETDAIDLAPASDACVLRDQGETWLVVFEGVARSVRDSKGMDYLAHLMRNPHRQIHSLALRDLVAGETPRAAGSAGEILDRQALREIKERLDANRAELDEARRDQDEGRVEHLEEEAEALRREVARATGLDGRLREAASHRKRARQAVSNAIHRAVREIARRHPTCAEHLGRSLRFGETLSYEPDRPLVWAA